MKLHHIAITVNNLQESRNFYESTFGFECVKEFGREDMGAYAIFLKLEDIHIELWEFKDMIENQDELTNIRVRGIRHIAFEVNDLQSSIEKLQKKGLNFSKPKLGASEHYYAFTSDPNGVAIELYEARIS